MTDDEAAEIEDQLSEARRLVEVAERSLAEVRADPIDARRGRRMRYVIDGIEAGAVQLSAISTHLKSVQPARPALKVIKGGRQRRERETVDETTASR